MGDSTPPQNQCMHAMEVGKWESELNHDYDQDLLSFGF